MGTGQFQVSDLEYAGAVELMGFTLQPEQLYHFGDATQPFG